MRNLLFSRAFISLEAGYHSTVIFLGKLAESRLNVRSAPITNDGVTRALDRRISVNCLCLRDASLADHYPDNLPLG